MRPTEARQPPHEVPATQAPRNPPLAFFTDDRASEEASPRPGLGPDQGLLDPSADGVAIKTGSDSVVPALFRVCVDGDGTIQEADEAAATLLAPNGGSLQGWGLIELGVTFGPVTAWAARVAAANHPVPLHGRLFLDDGPPRPVVAAAEHDRQQGCYRLTISVAEAEAMPATAAATVGPAASAAAQPLASADMLSSLERAADAARVGLVINTLAPDGAYTMAFVNRAGAKLLGEHPRDLMGGPAFPPHRQGPPREGSWSLVCPSKEGQSSLELGITEGDFHGVPAQFVLMKEALENTTGDEERKRLVRELYNANADLRNFGRATTHDLRAPLRSISGFAALLERRMRGRIDDDEARLINNIIASTRRMDQLIEALAEFSAIGARDIERRPVELNTVLGDVLSDLASELDQLDIHLQFPSLPCVHGDALLLRQLFQNLLGNAVKFRHQVPHRVSLGARDEDDWLVLEFMDNGVGMDLERAKDLFQPFRRYHDAAKFPGSGLGLATCKRIVEMHGGTISVASEPGRGSTFTVRLPK